MLGPDAVDGACELSHSLMRTLWSPSLQNAPSFKDGARALPAARNKEHDVCPVFTPPARVAPVVNTIFVDRVQQRRIVD